LQAAKKDAKISFYFCCVILPVLFSDVPDNLSLPLFSSNQKAQARFAHTGESTILEWALSDRQINIFAEVKGQDFLLFAHGRSSASRLGAFY